MIIKALKRAAKTLYSTISYDLLLYLVVIMIIMLAVILVYSVTSAVNNKRLCFEQYRVTQYVVISGQLYCRVNSEYVEVSNEK